MEAENEIGGEGLALAKCRHHMRTCIAAIWFLLSARKKRGAHRGAQKKGAAQTVGRRPRAAGIFARGPFILSDT